MMGAPEKQRYEGCDRRILILAVGAIALFGLLVAQLWRFQIVQGEDFARQAEKNRLCFQWLSAPRGMIVSQVDGKPVADTRPARDLVMVPALCEDREEEILERLAELIPIDVPRIMENVVLVLEESETFRHVSVKRNITRAELARVEEFSPILPGILTITRPQRRYLYGKAAGQIVGYVGGIGQKQLDALPEDSDYKRGDLIGWGGLERQHESLLRGKDGQLCVSRYAGSLPQLRYDVEQNAYVAMDVYGRVLKEEEKFRVEPVPGNPLYVTLDMALQQKAEALLEGATGAIVVLEATTGAVLAMASSPGYDPGVLLSGNRMERNAVLEDASKPMLSRAYRQNYPPGSVFKIMLAIGALEEGLITEHTAFGCDGEFYLPGVSRPWRCWRLKYGGHGSVSVVDALAFSCDEYFYNVGRLLGVDGMKKWSTKLGLGVKTGIDLPSEVTGLVPSREWKKAVMMKRHPEEPWEWRWHPGETINESIGQGSVATTPLQNAVMMAAVVNGGRLVRPYINAERGPDVSEPFVSAKTLELVHAGMLKCVEKMDTPSGTGRRAYVKGIQILGKTGTAQAVAMKFTENYEKEEDIPYELRDHALFVAGVLDRDPPIAVSIMVEHGLHGSTAAAPLAGKLIDYYYNVRRTRLQIARGDGPS
ncbi:MAG: penicillin-binding protein 2 [bacterium]|nr:penicillin-binding protein 2 [bacterium]